LISSASESTANEGVSAAAAAASEHDKLHKVCQGESGVFVISMDNGTGGSTTGEESTFTAAVGSKRKSDHAGSPKADKKKKKNKQTKFQKPPPTYDETKYDISADPTGKRVSLYMRTYIHTYIHT
jgi:hypothetical protein